MDWANAYDSLVSLGLFTSTVTAGLGSVIGLFLFCMGLHLIRSAWRSNDDTYDDQTSLQERRAAKTLLVCGVLIPASVLLQYYLVRKYKFFAAVTGTADALHVAEGALLLI